MRYIDADALLVKLKDLKEEWGFTFTADGVEEAIFEVEEEPTADVVPKSEYDAVVSAVDNSTKEFLKLHDEYQDAKSEAEKILEKLKVRECSNSVCAWCVHANDYGRRNEECDKPYIDKNGKEQKACYAYAKFESLIDNEFSELKKKYTEETYAN